MVIMTNLRSTNAPHIAGLKANSVHGMGAKVGAPVHLHDALHLTKESNIDGADPFCNARKA